MELRVDIECWRCDAPVRKGKLCESCGLFECKYCGERKRAMDEVYDAVLEAGGQAEAKVFKERSRRRKERGEGG